MTQEQPGRPICPQAKRTYKRSKEIRRRTAWRQNERDGAMSEQSGTDSVVEGNLLIVDDDRPFQQRLQPPQLDNANTANKNLGQESNDTAPAPRSTVHTRGTVPCNARIAAPNWPSAIKQGNITVSPKELEAEEQAKREAEEQAKRKAEEQARRMAVRVRSNNFWRARGVVEVGGGGSDEPSRCKKYSRIPY